MPHSTCRGDLRIMSKRITAARSYRLAVSAQRLLRCRQTSLNTCSSTIETLRTPAGATGVGEAFLSSSESLSTYSVKLASHVKKTSKRSSYLTRERDLVMTVPRRVNYRARHLLKTGNCLVLECQSAGECGSDLTSCVRELDTGSQHCKKPRPNCRLPPLPRPHA
jgi:hypothetical protein